MLVDIFAACTKKDALPPPAPVADFSFAVINDGLLPAIVSFTSTSKNATSYTWEFGDGATSTQANPTHQFAATGTYSIKLTATGQGGTNSISKNIVVTLSKPKVSFTYTITNNGGYPVRVNFTNTSTNAQSYYWDFDNGDTSTAFSPIDSFFAVKTFIVKLVAINPAGRDSITMPVSITINKPTAAFDFALDNGGQAPCNGSFTNQSINGASYKWYFSNGLASTDKNPSISYDRPRTFTAKLVASNPGGSDSITKSIIVRPIMKSVVCYLITPRDKKFNQAYYDALKATVLNLQSWYKTQMGNNKTFVTNPIIVDTLTGLHDSVWYNSAGPNSGTEPRYYGYYNTFYEMNQLLGTAFHTGNYVYFIYVAAPGGGAGTTGFCAMGDQDLKGLLGINPENPNIGRWIGGGGHELGHAFGLPHPDNQNGQSIMWTGYTIYPNCILQQTDRNILNASAFFR